MNGDVRRLDTFPAVCLPAASGGLPVEVVLIAQIGVGAGSPLIAATAALPRFAYAAAATPKRLVFVIQRGAADGLATVAPTGDPAFAAARRALADEASGGAKLDGLVGSELENLVTRGGGAV